MSKKLFTKVVSLSLTAAMVLSMAPVNASAAKAVKPKSMKAPKASKIKVGQTKTITASRKSKKSTNDVKYVNFKPAKTKNIGIGVKTSDDTIVSVEKVSNGKYTYTGVTTGTATLTITSRAKTAKGKKLQAKLDVTVINPFKVTQTGAYTFTMSTADKLEKVDIKDIKVTQEGSNNGIDNAVKEAKLSEDKMSVEVTMHVPFVDQKKYEVTFGKEKDSFVASVGAPAAINIKTQTVVANKATEVEYAIVDAKGMDVTKTLDENKITVNVSVKNGFYDTKKKEVTIFKVGDTAEATVVYHTWTYDQKTGKEIVVEGKGTITAVDKSSVTVVGIDKYTIGDTVLSWDTDEMISMMPQQKSKNIFVRMKKSDGTYVDNLGKEKANFKFSATNSSVVTVDEDGKIYAFRQGTAYVKVVYTDFNVKYEYTLPVTVSAPSVASAIFLSPSYVTISKTSNVPTIVIAQVKDQYGEVLDVNPSDFTNDYLNGAKVATISNVSSAKVKNMKIGVLPSATQTTGSGLYKISYRINNLNTTLTVNSIEVGDKVPVSYLLKPVDITEFDATITPNTLKNDLNDLEEGITFRLYETKANVITGAAKDIMGLNQSTVKGKERFASVSVDGYTLLDNNFADGGEFRVVSDFVSVNDDSNEFTIKPVIFDSAKKNVLLTQKSGTHKITVSFWVEDKDNPGSFKKVVLSHQYTVKNDTKDGIEGEQEDYTIEKKVQLSTKNAVNMAKAVVIAQKANELPAGEWEKDFFYMVSSGRGKWSNTSLTNDQDPAEEMKYDAKYNLDTAPIPTYKTAEDTVQVWTLKSMIARDIELTADPIISVGKIVMSAHDADSTIANFDDTEWGKLTPNYKVFYRTGNTDKVVAFGTELKAPEWTEASDPKQIDSVEMGQKIQFALAYATGNKFVTMIGIKEAVVEPTLTSVTAAANIEIKPCLEGKTGMLTLNLVGKHLDKLESELKDSATYLSVDGTNPTKLKVTKVESVKFTDNNTKAEVKVTVTLQAGVAENDEAAIQINLLTTPKTAAAVVKAVKADAATAVVLKWTAGTDLVVASAVENIANANDNTKVTTDSEGLKVIKSASTNATNGGNPYATGNTAKLEIEIQADAGYKDLAAVLSNATLEGWELDGPNPGAAIVFAGNKVTVKLKKIV